MSPRGEVRDLHIGVIGPLLHQKANDIQKVYEERNRLQNTPEIVEFMKKFKVRLVFEFVI